MDLEKRMEALKKGLQRHKWTIDYQEKHVRLHQWVGLVACCLVLALVAWTFWPGPRTVEAGKFLLIDQAGITRGVWRMNDGNPEFGMEREDGRELRLALNEHGSGLMILDSKRKGRFIAGILNSEPGREEVPVVALLSADNEAEVKIAGPGNPKEFYGLKLVDSSGKVRGVLGVVNDDEPMLSLNDSEGRFRTMLIFMKDGKSRFMHLDEKDRILWSAPLKSN